MDSLETLYCKTLMAPTMCLTPLALLGKAKGRFMERPQYGQHMLGICENWADTIGLQFAPEKCVYLRVPEAPNQLAETAFSIHGRQIQSADVLTYLGIPFTCKGIDLHKSISLRTKASVQLIATMYAWHRILNRS